MNLNEYIKIYINICKHWFITRTDEGQLLTDGYFKQEGLYLNGILKIKIGLFKCKYSQTE